ncbi:hypothetical protein CPC08DRAFT_767725 [Agrocybe pediades]|nr:hypothetical protein CPC08DRAFT_767725 [Agrocybe pediades]
MALPKLPYMTMGRICGNVPRPNTSQSVWLNIGNLKTYIDHWTLEKFGFIYVCGMDDVIENGGRIRAICLELSFGHHLLWRCGYGTSTIKIIAAPGHDINPNLIWEESARSSPTSLYWSGLSPIHSANLISMLGHHRITRCPNYKARSTIIAIPATYKWLMPIPTSARAVRTRAPSPPPLGPGLVRNECNCVFHREDTPFQVDEEDAERLRSVRDWRDASRSIR